MLAATIQELNEQQKPIDWNAANIWSPTNGLRIRGVEDEERLFLFAFFFATKKIRC